MSGIIGIMIKKEVKPVIKMLNYLKIKNGGLIPDRKIDNILKSLKTELGPYMK